MQHTTWFHVARCKCVGFAGLRQERYTLPGEILFLMRISDLLFVVVLFLASPWPSCCCDAASSDLMEDFHEDLRGGYGERRPDMAYGTTAPLFEFNVLVTGYEPFLDHAVNPAHEVAVSLNDTCDTVFLRHPHTMLVCYRGVSVPVTTEGSNWTASALQDNPRRWDGILHLGFESSARGLRLETIAANVKSSEEYGHMWNANVPCEKEGTPFRYISEGSPCLLPTTAPLSYLDLEGLTALLEYSGHGDLVSLETWSRDAGAYYCNEQFYRTLHAIRVLAPADDGASMVPAMFVHLPDVSVMGLAEMAVMVRFVAQSIMVGTIGLLPESCRR